MHLPATCWSIASGVTECPIVLRIDRAGAWMTAYLEAIAALLGVALVLSTRSRLQASRAARVARLRSERYRQAFVELLRGDFTDLDDMLLRLLRCVRDTLVVERVSLWLFDETRSSIQRRALVVTDEQRAEGPAQLDGASHPRYFAAVSQAFVIAADDAVADERTIEFKDEYLSPLGIGAMLDVPLRRFGAHIGLMCIEHQGGSRKWTAEDQLRQRHCQPDHLCVRTCRASSGARRTGGAHAA